MRYIDDNVEKGKDWFIVGEYWREDFEFLVKYIEYMDYWILLFDVLLCFNLSKIFMVGERGDLRDLFKDVLCLWKFNNVVVSFLNFLISDKV